ncbi:MAG: hypothetical protein K2L13_02775 [Opitutales bacterium]|nr:hypothetical protein [Opitutales bacterium]
MSLKIPSDLSVRPQADDTTPDSSTSLEQASQKTAKINLTTRAKIVLSTLGGSSVICGVFAALGALSVIALPTTAIAVLIGAAAALAATAIAYAIISLKQNHTPKTQGTNESTSPKEIQNNSQQPQTENVLNGAIDTKDESSPNTNNSPENQIQNGGESLEEQNKEAATNGTLKEQNEAQSIIGDGTSGEFNPSNPVDKVKNESPESNDNKPNPPPPDNVNSANKQSSIQNPEAPQNKASGIPASSGNSAAKPEIRESHKPTLQSNGQNLQRALSKEIKKTLPIGAASKQDSTNIGIVGSLCELRKSYENSIIMTYKSSTDVSKASNKKASTLYSTHRKSGDSSPIDVLRSRLSNVYKKHSSILTIGNGDVFRSKTLNELDALKQKMHQKLEQVLKQQIEKENILSNLDAMERQRSKFTNDKTTSDNPQANATLTEQYKKLKELDALLTFYNSKGSKNYQKLQKNLNDIQNSMLPTGNDLLTEVEKLSKALKQKSEALG